MSPTTTPRPATERSVPTRRVSFEESLRTLPKHFAADGDLIMSHLAASLSAVFPEGEDFFVRSVRNYRDQITDPALKRDVAGFIGQEAVHGREHRALNDRLDELGYPTKAVDRFTGKALRFRERHLSNEVNLATTAALEHFTATLAELLLTNEEARGLFGDEQLQGMFLWHALEESEHKAVAFDVYKAVGGSERVRTITMTLIMYGFVIGMALQILISLAGDKAARNPRRLYRSWKQFKRSPLVSKELWRQLKDYNRPDFHPDDRDTTGLVAEWRERLFGDRGTLSDKLTTGRAA